MKGACPHHRRHVGHSGRGGSVRCISRLLQPGSEDPANSLILRRLRAGNFWKKPGSAWGAGGRRFNSALPGHNIAILPLQSALSPEERLCRPRQGHDGPVASPSSGARIREPHRLDVCTKGTHNEAVGFEWDEESNAGVNFRKHGVRMPEAIPVFDDPYAITIADDESDPDQR